MIVPCLVLVGFSGQPGLAWRSIAYLACAMNLLALFWSCLARVSPHQGISNWFSLLLQLLISNKARSIGRDHSGAYS